MGFSEFQGNPRVVSALRAMLAGERVPHALLFTGPRGIGKFTLARMFAQAANCERLRDDFCGQCEPCRRTGLLANLQPLVAQGLAERGESADAATVERVPLLVQPHPDVCAIVPDPVRLKSPVARPVIRMGQLRAVQRAASFKPLGRRRVFLLDGAETMRWDYANIFLKVLEEPPESAIFILTAPNANQLLTTIVSRCLHFYLAPMLAEDVEKFLKGRNDWKPAERRLAAQLSGGSPGAALSLDLEESARLRLEVFRVLKLAVEGQAMSTVFAQTSQLSKAESAPFENILELFYSLLTDLLELSYGPSDAALRNPDLRRELESLGKTANLNWFRTTVGKLDTLHARLRRNINRNLGLDALAASLAAGGR